MALRPSKIGGVADSGDPAKIQPSDVNPEGVPSVPAEGDQYTERTGTSPNRFIRKYVYDGGSWRIADEFQY